MNVKRCNFYLKTGYTKKNSSADLPGYFYGKKMGKRGGMDVIN